LTALRDDGRLQKRHERIVVTEGGGSVSPIPATDAGLEWSDELRKLRRVVATLTTHQRTAFVLRYGHGMTNAEIARVLEISLKGAEQLTARLTKLVRERFRDPSV
jgi:RNA polymerase sigma factor (sigma-70 family)